VRWGNLRTFYTRSGTGKGTFFSWDIIGSGEDMALTTTHGLRFRDTRAQLRLLYGALSVESGSWEFYAQNRPTGISGTLSNGTYGAGITHLQGGVGCGS
jgi:hypothetical protein